MGMITNHYGYTIDLDFGAVERLAQSLAAISITRPMICTDAGIVAVGLLDKVHAHLPVDMTVEIYSDTPPNPTEAAVMAASAQYRASDCDGVVALGGGSPIDLAKGVALMATHDGTVSDWLIGKGGPARIKPCAPLIAIPTTAGTGSECSAGAVIITNEGIKSGIRSPHLCPRIAICDPDLTLGLPASLTAATGMDTFTHCLEAYLSPIDNPVAAVVALDGLARVHKYLKRAVDDGSDREARYELMLAASEGAMGFAKGLGIVHAMSHALGADQQLRLHHGTLNAVLLPVMFRYNAAHVGDKYAQIKKTLDLPADTDLADWIAQYNASIGIPATLAELGVSDEMIPHLAEHCMQDPCHMLAPQKPTVEEYKVMFAAAMR